MSKVLLSIIILLLSIIILLTLVSSLSAIAINDYIGTWSLKKGNSKMSIELKNDGSCITGENTRKINGNWTQQKDDSLIIKLEKLTGLYYKAEITKGNKLKITKVIKGSESKRTILLEKQK
jgi:hypothetical protein